jgi:multiple sugar transport system substrate-binding protein
MRKASGLFVSLAALAFTVAAAQAKDQIRVVVGFYSAATQGIFEGMPNDFTAAHPDVDVKIEVVQWDNPQRLTTTSQAELRRYRTDRDPVVGHDFV